MPILSIIIGVRNRNSLRIKRCLDSLLNQQERDFEVVLVDYGSDELFKSDLANIVNQYNFVNLLY